MTGKPDLASIAECQDCGEIAAAEDGFDVFKWAVIHSAVTDERHSVSVYAP